MLCVRRATVWCVQGECLELPWMGIQRTVSTSVLTVFLASFRPWQRDTRANESAAQSCMLPSSKFCMRAAYAELYDTMASISDLAHRGIVLTLVGVSAYGVFLGYSVHNDTLKRGRGPLYSLCFRLGYLTNFFFPSRRGEINWTRIVVV